MPTLRRGDRLGVLGHNSVEYLKVDAMCNVLSIDVNAALHLVCLFAPSPDLCDGQTLDKSPQSLGCKLQNMCIHDSMVQLQFVSAVS